jgi:hypothetical protein
MDSSGYPRTSRVAICETDLAVFVPREVFGLDIYVMRTPRSTASAVLPTASAISTISPLRLGSTAAESSHG